MTRPSRPLPVVGEEVVVRYLGSTEAGRVVTVDGARVLVETERGREWFELRRSSARFVREGDADFPRLSWPEP